MSVVDATRAGDTAIEAVAVSTTDCLVLRVGECSYALRLDDVVEVHQLVAATAAPDPRGGLVGYIDIRGHAVPAIDLRSALGMEERSWDATMHMVVASVDDELVVLAVDRVAGEAAGVLDSTGPGAAHPAVCAVARIDDLGLVPVLDPKALLVATAIEPAAEGANRDADGPLSAIDPRDLAILERRAKALAGRPAQEATSTLRVFLFRVGDEAYGLPVDVVREVVSGMVPTPVPGAPASVRGVVSLRGEIVSVIDPGVRLGLDGVAGPRPVLAVIRRDDVCTALAVDSIDDIVEVPRFAIEPPLPILDRAVADAVAGSFDTPEGPVALLSAAPLLEPFGSER